MSHTHPVSPQLRSRKPKMVPRVSQTEEESQRSGCEMVELSNFNIPAAVLTGGEHSLTKTLIDPGGLGAGGDQGATGLLVDPSLPCNGHTVDEKIAGDGDSAKQESDNEDGDGGDDNGRQPLLPLRGEGGDEAEDEVVVVVEQEKETSLSIMLQVLLPYLIAGFGMVGAGMVLDVVQVLRSFLCVSLCF